MIGPVILAASWRDGLCVLSGAACRRELAGRAVKALAPDGRGGALAIIDGRSIGRRTPEGKWVTVATSDLPLSCCVEVGEVIYAGTDDAQVLRVSAAGQVERLRGFDGVPGRDTWYAGSALVDGRLVGPPLGIRSMSATSDGAVLLANVHVGGIPRSVDGGLSWQPTIAIDADVHEVCSHPRDPGIVIAASAIGLCISRDAGATWTIEQRGLHATYCSAVAFSGSDVLVAASAGHFATEGALYRRPIDGEGPLAPVGGGFPRWLEGIADTGCITSRASCIVVGDRGGRLYLSMDAGGTWSHHPNDLPDLSGVLVV